MQSTYTQEEPAGNLQVKNFRSRSRASQMIPWERNHLRKDGKGGISDRSPIEEQTAVRGQGKEDIPELSTASSEAQARRKPQMVMLVDNLVVIRQIMNRT